MWRVPRMSVAAILLLTFSCIDLQPAPAQIAGAAVAAGTVGAFLDGLRSTVKQLEDSAHSLIDHGNIALAQQQMLLAGILSRTIEQTAAAYGNALDKTFAQLSVAEQSTFKELADQVNSVGTLEDKSAKDVQGIVYKTQGAANQLLDRLPIGERYPIFYGVTVRDLMTDPAQHPADVEIVGFHLSDPRLERKSPMITVAGESIPDALISLQEDRINLQIPDAIKTKIGFGNKACDPRKTFPISMTAYYAVNRGFWPISWSSEKQMKFNSNALPGADLYDVSVTYSGTRTSTPLVPHTFTARSGYANMGCEETTSAGTRFEMPAAAQQIQCSAAWVDTSNVGSSSQNCAVGGVVATASGSMRGRNRDCVGGGMIPRICNCPGGGHGTLQISGNYVVPEPKVEDLNGVKVGDYTVIGNSDMSTALPLDATVQIKNVGASIARKGCQTILDTISLNVPVANSNVTQNSTSGLFKATFWNGQLNVKKQ